MIVRVWQGKLALWKTFWLFGAGGWILIGLSPAISMLARFGYLGLFSGYLGLISGIVFLLFALVLLHYYLIWVSVGIWRAAEIYQGNPVWAVLAKLTVAVGTLIVALLIGGDLWIFTISSGGI